MGAGRAMVATERVVTRVVEAPSSNAGPVPTHHQIMADLIVLDQLHRLQAVRTERETGRSPHWLDNTSPGILHPAGTS